MQPPRRKFAHELIELLLITRSKRLQVFEYRQLKLACAGRVRYFHEYICHAEERNVSTFGLVVNFDRSHHMVEFGIADQHHAGCREKNRQQSRAHLSPLLREENEECMRGMWNCP